MHLLLAQLISLLTLTSPLASCDRAGSAGTRPDAPATSSLYTVAQSNAIARDSINQTISGSRRNAITTAVAKASPAVVGINVTEEIVQQYRDPFDDFFGNDPMFQRFFGRSQGGYTQKFQVKGLGSGFIISSDGYILTNDHVAGNAKKIIVTTTDGSQYDAKLIGSDKTADVALLKIDADKKLPFIPLGNSDDLAVGEWAIAMGNPFGLFDINNKPTVTVGVISNTGVNLGLEDGRNYRDMIQTDAAISSGNSGGPLLNAAGQVIGINAVIRSTATGPQGAGSIGLGFAIPVNKVKVVADRLRKGIKTNNYTGDVGFRVANLTDDVKQYFHITNSFGVVVIELRHNSMADRAGLQAGDVIVGVDNDRIRSADELQSIIADHQVGDVVTLHVQREGAEKDVRLKLTA